MTANTPRLATRFVDTVLGTLRVQVSTGTGPAILIWPSLLMTGDLWSGQAAHFGDSHRLVLIDPPGHGGSAPLHAMFSFTDCARCVVDLLDGLAIDTAHFVGNSWGGMIGGTFAALYPDRLNRAVLMNCTASKAGVAQKVQYAVLVRLATALGGIRPPLTHSAVRAFLGPTTLRTRPDVVDTVRNNVQTVDTDSVRWAVRSVVSARPDQHALLGRVTAPVLVVAGAEDATFPVAETRAMADSIRGASFTVLDGVAHLAALEDPGRVNALLDTFLFG
ncbi:putative hydrolase, alpha/beta fold protein [Mycobacterium mantenii]|uniref:Hydrolase, alpha/beta fold protein n=1 Tax=Mycobacterium mantenii TaxID=560555 RepID=A0ABM7JWK5_MYCNT|nr:alpha/beta hydrolase [Mycobacterium mantenii]MCV7242420.1 alpha/beta fold hydrolase [Mycobacterium mantenii]BBY39546.1 putative hydrolase, alpha/beta fold protein [Mycobacterium mantenii]